MPPNVELWSITSSMTSWECLCVINITSYLDFYKIHHRSHLNTDVCVREVRKKWPLNKKIHP